MNDFNTKVINFVNNISFKDTGAIKTHNKIITHEGISKEARGKSVDTKMSRETFEEFEDFPNHPRFEYEVELPSKVVKTKRNRDRLKESINKSTSPRMNRNSTVKHMNVNYITSNKPCQNVTYNPKDLSQERDRVKDLVFQNDPKIKKNMHNLPSSKNHRSMLKLHEKGLRKGTDLIDHEKSAASTNTKNYKLNLDKTSNLLAKYNKGGLTKIMEVPNTERSNYSGLEPNKLKPSKSRSRYDNEILSSTEKEESNNFKRKASGKYSRLEDYSANHVKRSKEE